MYHLPPSSEAPVSLVLSGFGPVGKCFIELTRAKQHQGLLNIAAIRGHTSEIHLPPSADVPDRSLWGPLLPPAESLRKSGATILVQAIPSSPEAHQRAVEEAVTALYNGIDVVTATKSHLITHWGELQAAATTGGSRIRISGATGAALPTADLARVALTGLDCEAIRACPNGTSTFVLDQISQGNTLEEAIIEARKRGIAESETQSDLSGSDSATKVRLIAGLLWGWDVARIKVETETIDQRTAAKVEAAARQGSRLRAVATASTDQPMLVTVKLEQVEPTDPLFHINGPEKAMVFRCPSAGDITVQGGRSSPAGAALAMLKDVLNLTSNNPMGFR
ncbi:homoserine dehydrogenase [Arthrobacter sp. Leaf145]|nr:homoserine dehydrogenase [Arthrobacter sp. MWB30]KQQ97973.1 homoserine dehydrogenase [Arthrobacter sp. Leaf145]